jgi:hypothetical protein
VDWEGRKVSPGRKRDRPHAPQVDLGLPWPTIPRCDRLREPLAYVVDWQERVGPVEVGLDDFPGDSVERRATGLRVGYLLRERRGEVEPEDDRKAPPVSDESPALGKASRAMPPSLVHRFWLDFSSEARYSRTRQATVS